MEHEGLAPQMCHHNVPAMVKTSMTERNPARRFYSCRRREIDDCGFWVWIDPELSPYYKQAFYRMKLENDRVDERLNSQMLMENLHSDRYMMKVRECEAVQRKLDKARASIEELELELKKKEIQIKKKDWKMKVLACVFATFIVAFMSMV